MNAPWLTRIAERIILLEGWRAAVLAIVMGALSALSLAPYHISPILFLTIPVLVWLLDGAVAPAGSHGSLNVIRRFWPAFRTGWMFGFGFFLAGFWWVGKAFLVEADEFAYLLPVAVTVLPAGLALFWGLATALARLAWSEGWVRIVALAAALTLGEWVRGIFWTGLPWNTIGYAAMPTPMFMQTSAVIGLYGVTFFALVAAGALGVFAPSQKRRMAMPIAAILLVIVHGGYGLLALSSATTETIAGVKLRIVQPAINQSKKWDPANEAEIMQRYLDLSNANKGPDFGGAAAFTHIIWPESAFPFILTQRRDQLAAIANILPPTTTLITGAMRLEEAVGDSGSRRKVFNALYALNGNGEITSAYDKTQLVPFGEFLPFQNFLEGLGFEQLTRQRGGFSHGNRRRSIALAGAPAFLPLICHEITYAGRIVGEGERPGWIVNLTNDAWFGNTAGPYQHAHQAQVRAVEEGLPVIRAANSGISMVIDANGRIREQLALGAQGVVDSALPVASSPTYYGRTGNLPSLVFICFVFIILVGVRSINTKRL